MDENDNSSGVEIVFGCEEEIKSDSKQNIDNVKKKIVFPDENIIVFYDYNSDEFQFVEKKIRNYINNNDFDSIGKIEIFFISRVKNPFWPYNTDSEVLGNDHEKEKNAIESLKNNLKKEEYKPDQPSHDEIISRFISDFFDIDQEDIDINDRSVSNDSVENKIISETIDNNAELTDAEKNQHLNIPLFGDAAIYKGKNNLLYADYKVGKSYFSIEVAKHESIQKPLFIVLEDYSSDQAIRYENNLKEKEYLLMNLEDFDERYETEKAKKMYQGDLETIGDVYISQYRRIKVLHKQNYIEMGIINSESEKLDKIAVIEKIIKEELDKGRDFICIDPLFAILKSGRELTRDHLKRIILPSSKKHITFLLLHHETKTKNMALSNELKNTFDNIYRLEIINQSDEGFADLRLTEEGARDNQPHVLTIKRTILQDKKVNHELINTKIFQPGHVEKKNNMKSIVNEIILNHNEDILSYQTLLVRLKNHTNKNEIDEANIKKILKSIKEDSNIIEMADGKTWLGGIRIIKGNISP
jgi:hypothetical protein